MTLIVQSYFDTLLRYVLSVTFCRAVVMKVMDQKTLIEKIVEDKDSSLSADEVIRFVEQCIF